MERLRRHVELVANIAIIVVAVLLCVVLAKRFLFPPTPTPSEPGIVAGTPVAIPTVDWSKSDKTLVLALQKDCHFCTDSAPFYRTLVTAAAAKSIRLLAVLPQEESVGREYLKGLNVQIGEVRQLPLNSIHVRGTPTLILVNNSGTVIKSWVGKLPEQEEKELLSTL